MFYSTCGPDAFNKTAGTGQGTLIKNWQEERILRDETGEGRTLPRSHMSKRHHDLFTKPVNELGTVYAQNDKQDETYGRVFGRKHEPNYQSDYRDKFTRKTFYQEPTYGKKHELIEKQFLNEINKELEVTGKNWNKVQNERFLSTTYGNEFAAKNVGLNVVGRKVMRDQNGGSLAPNTRDEDLLVDHGFLKRNPISDEAQLKEAVQKESYVRAQPYTFWAEKKKEGVFYNSQETNEQAPFTRNNGFLKTFHNYSHNKN